MKCKKVYVETYGCRMNICDSEIILGILSGHGYEYTNVLTEADCVILNCCSVREIGHEKAYERVRKLEKHSNHTSYSLLLGACPHNLMSLSSKYVHECNLSYILQRTGIYQKP